MLSFKSINYRHKGAEDDDRQRLDTNIPRFIFTVILSPLAHLRKPFACATSLILTFPSFSHPNPIFMTFTISRVTWRWERLFSIHTIFYIQECQSIIAEGFSDMKKTSIKLYLLGIFFGKSKPPTTFTQTSVCATGRSNQRTGKELSLCCSSVGAQLGNPRDARISAAKFSFYASLNYQY